MTTVNYHVESGQLVAKARQDGTTIWTKRFCAPVIQAVAVPAVDGCLVLLDAGATKPPTLENLLLVTPVGDVRWKAQLRGSHDSFTEIVERQGGIEAATWFGFRVAIDLTSGQTKEIGFFK